jgi:molybdopterin-biosynthesis enzyme MoeA-like protein
VILAPFLMVGVIWLYTMIFTFSALWFTHYGLAVLANLRAAETAMRAVQPAVAPSSDLQLVEEVPPHERFGYDDSAENPSKESMNFGALIIGDEILSGRREDKHLARTIAALESRGLALAWAHYIGDEPARIVAEIRAAAASGDTVFSFGGIGATPDDHTRQCAAQALGVELALHPQAAVLDRAARRSRWRRRRARLRHRVGRPPAPPQHGRVPGRRQIIPNPYNRIPGFSVGHLHFMPGFPVMAHPMLDWLLDTLYADQAGALALRRCACAAPTSRR